MEIFNGLTWRDIGLGSALLIYIIINHWRDVASAVADVYRNHATHVHDKREFGQSMTQREYDHEAQTKSAQLSHKIAVDHAAFNIVERLLDDRAGMLDKIRDSLLEITKLLAQIQLAEDSEVKIHERRLKDLSNNLRAQWGTLAEILEELRRINGTGTKRLGKPDDNE